jgi:hypothetical protein
MLLGVLSDESRCRVGLLVVGEPDFAKRRTPAPVKSVIDPFMEMGVVGKAC